jgi:hypothetical protein
VQSSSIHHHTKGQKVIFQNEPIFSSHRAGSFILLAMSEVAEMANTALF